MARTKYTAKMRTVQEDHRLVETGKVERLRGKVPKKPSGEKRSVFSGLGVRGGKQKPHCFQPGMKVLLEIRRFQKSTNCLIPKWPFYRVMRELLQAERSWMKKIKASAILALHEAVEAYVIKLMEDSHICVIHVKWITVMTKDMQLVRQTRGEI